MSDVGSMPRTCALRKPRRSRSRRWPTPRWAEIGEARKDAAADKLDADYKVAIEKCDALAGDAKNSCVAAAKTKFGKN